MGLFRSTTITTRANKISSFTVNTAEYGAAVPEILGTTRIAGNVIYYDDFTAHEHRETHKAGKGGKSKSVNITYTYTVAAIIGLCEGTIKAVKRIWQDKDIYNYGDGKVPLTLYDGSQTSPWEYVVGKHPEKALPYTGLAYMAGVIDLGDSGSMPSYNFEVQGKLTNTGDGLDVNPADYIRYILDKVGLSSVEIIGLDDYRAYCKAYDYLISTPMDEVGSTKEAREIINDIISLTNAYMFWSNNAFKIVIREDRSCGSWKPNKTITYDLDADDLLPQSGKALVTYVRKDSSELYNQFPVEFINRSNGYEKETVSYALTDDINDYGVRQASTTNAHYLYTKERAVKLAERLARDSIYGRVKYTFKLDWSFCRLEVGDLVTLTDPACGLEKETVMIDSVTENTDGTITCTAISYPQGDYGVAAYDVKANDRPYIDYNVTAPNTVPVFLQPPADLTTTGLELWIGGKGESDNWGGCVVYVSDDNTNYREAGTISSTARFGKLAKAMTATDTSVTVTTNGDFISGTQQDAERGNTLIWVDGECMSYQTATLNSNGTWTLNGCIRGQYNTTASTHAVAVTFCRLDASLLKIPFSMEDVGKKIYLKFVSYNVFGTGMQELSDVDEYEYTLLPYYIPSVTNVTAYNRYRQLKDGVSRYDIVVKWDKPTMATYASADVWYKTNYTQDIMGVKPANGLTASNIGFARDWTYGGNGVDSVVIPQANVGDTYRIAVCTKDKWGVTTSPDTAPKKDITVAMRADLPNTPAGLSLTFGKVATLSWLEVTNTDIAFYEIRTDTAYGAETDGLLARTNDTTATLPLTSRRGTIYLYAKNAMGKYSTPAILKYNKALPVTPAAPALVSTLKGFNVQAKADVPNGCIGMAIYISNSSSNVTKVTTENNVYSYICGAGIYDVQIAWYDLFGEGNKSGSSRVTIKAQVDAELLADEAISLSKVDNNLKRVFNTTIPNMQEGIDQITNTTIPNMQEGIDQITNTTIPNMQEGITQNSDSITALVKDGKGYASAIAQNTDSITALVKDGKGYASAIAQNTDSINTLVQDGKGYASAIAQNSDSIKTLVEDGKGYASAIAQNTDSINTLVQDGKGYASAIAQNSDSIKTLVQDGKGYASAIAQNSDSIKTLVEDGKGYASAIAQNTDSITAVVTNLNTKDGYKNYTALSQLNDAINLRVAKNDVINQINMTSETTTIDGKHLHVTGNTVFDKNVVVSGMIQAGAVTANKLSVDSLSAITANVGDLTGGTISGTTLIGSTIKNKDGSFTVDSNGNITGATLKAGTIDGSKVKINGYEVHSVAMIGGVASTYQFTIPLPSGYTEDQCVWGAYPAVYLGNYQIIFSGRGIGNEYGRTYRIDNGNGDAKAKKTFYWCIGIK